MVYRRAVLGDVDRALGKWKFSQSVDSRFCSHRRDSRASGPAMLPHSHSSQSKPFVRKEVPSKLNMSNAQRCAEVTPCCAGSLCEAVVLMESDNSKRAKESGLRERRYAIRYPFAAHPEMLELESGNRVSGVTSDISAGGSFVCLRRPLKIGARVRGTLTHNDRKVEILAVVRSVKTNVGMGLEFLDLDPNSHATLLAWIRTLPNLH